LRLSKLATLTIPIAAVSLLAACGSSGGTASSTTSPAGSAGGSTSSAVAPGVQAAKAFAALHEQTPTSIGVTAPLSKKPPTGKLIVTVTTTEASTIVKDNGIGAGAKALGWTYKEVPIQNTANGPAQAFQLALAMHPSGITIGGNPPATVAAQLAEACAQHIPVVYDSQPITPAQLKQYPCIISQSLNGTAQLAYAAKLVAAEIVSQTNGNAHVALFNVPSYPVLVAEASAFKSAMQQYCPSTCSVNEVDVQVTDVGTPVIPSDVVNFVRSHSNTNWMFSTFGDIADGVEASLQTAGLASQVALGGLNMTQAELAGLKSGQPGAWAAQPQPITGWRADDIFARYFLGDSLTPTLAYPPIQLLTPQNAGSAVVDPGSGFWVGVATYAQDFEQLWHV
jgi:ribose transport system substrate-binding protein